MKKSQAGCWKQIGGEMRRDPAEQGWPQHNSGEHLADHARLLKLPEERTRQAACG
jgi:hypothetical protein